MIFVDTSAFFALLNAADHAHLRARAAWEAHVDARATFATTNYIEVEATALLQNRIGMNAVRMFRQILPVCTIHRIGEPTHAAAVALHLQHNRRKLSLVDCTSVEAMRSLGIDRAFAYDKHFAEFGFTLV